ncbi:MAG: YggS family pyridoxal phosphate-dependent enzyme [Verrucomicrobiae bacterium]|nr:YggS family pyridoxal phosphate-dependent enzyme [Verrucomicrobiae bacterium]
MEIADNIAEIRLRMDEACERAGRSSDSVKLMGVSKTHPASAIREAFDAGLTLFGENKIQEAALKIPDCPDAARFHFIGHLQSNKARDAARLFAMVQGVDKLGTAIELNKRADQLARDLPILLEVNVAGEASKFGYTPATVLEDLERLMDLPRLELHGFMTIPPFAADPERARPYFRALRELRNRCEDLAGIPFPELSMGMSGDFEIAIEEGSTLVRVGTAIFGKRKFSNLKSPA